MSRPPDAKQENDEGFLRHLDSYYQELTSFNYVKITFAELCTKLRSCEETRQRLKVHDSNRQKDEKSNLEGDNGALYSLFLPNIPLFNTLTCFRVQPLSSGATFL